MKRPFRKKNPLFSSFFKKESQSKVHPKVVGLFVVSAALLVLLNFVIMLAPEQQRLLASTAENVKGYAWNSWAGWISMNNSNDGGAVSYGVHINPTTLYMTGYAWTPHAGWICFGSTCSGTTPAGGSPTAQVINVAGDWEEVRGWAQFVALGTNGWISLNCEDRGICITKSDYKVLVNFASGAFDGFAWHAISGSTGWGWTDFSRVVMDMSAVEDGDTGDPGVCTNNTDDDLDGDVDCADSGCMYNEDAGCPTTEPRCTLFFGTDCCSNTIDDDYDGPVDCTDPDCVADPVCITEICDNDVDDNVDGFIDCADPDCLGASGCEICDNEIDDDSDGMIDCLDDNCSTDPYCTPAWLKSEYGNIYAKIGISGNAPPVGQKNATYCLSSAGTITNFTSGTNCVEANQEAISLPVGKSGYVSTLGQLDVTGILNGRYGQVVTISNLGSLPQSLNGKVYVYSNPSCASTPVDFGSGTETTVFANASVSSAKGSGLLVINGCDLRIIGNLTYQSQQVSDYLKNLASLGIIVLAKYDGDDHYVSGGNLYIQPTVGQIIGTIFAERSVHTGTTGLRSTDIQLHVYGALISREISLERLKSTESEPAEVIEFDGRSVLNPPPGFQDVGKSLPALTDRY
jgi:hypothetical protein